jgi:predicted transcriptional regulator
MKISYKHTAQELHQRYASGMSLIEVGRLEGVGPQAIRSLFRLHSLPVRRGGRPVGSNKCSYRELSAEQTGQIVRLYLAGQSIQSVANQLSLTRSVVSHCVDQQVDPSRRRRKSGKNLRAVRGDHIICCDCGRRLPRSHFYNNSTSATRKMPYCRACALARNRRYAYGVTPEQYRLLLQQQGGVAPHPP